MEKIKLILLSIGLIIFIAFLFFGGGFVFFLVPLLLPGLGLGIIFIFVCSFLIKKFFETRNKKYIAIILLILFLIFLSAFIFCPPVKGRVIDSTTGGPVVNTNVEQRIFLLNAVINPGGESSKIWRVYETKTDENGNFYFSTRLNMTVPLYKIFAGMTFAVNLSGELSQKYNNITYSYFNGEELAYSMSYSDACSSCGGGYEDSSRIEFPWFDYSNLGNKELLVIPRVKNIKECDLIKNDKLISECKKVNSERLISETKDISLCSNLEFYNSISCVSMFAAKFRDQDLCWSVYDFQGDGDDFDSCLVGVSNEKQDYEICNSIKGRQWKEGLKGGLCGYIDK